VEDDVNVDNPPSSLLNPYETDGGDGGGPLSRAGTASRPALRRIASAGVGACAVAVVLGAGVAQADVGSHRLGGGPYGNGPFEKGRTADVTWPSFVSAPTSPSVELLPPGSDAPPASTQRTRSSRHHGTSLRHHRKASVERDISALRRRVDALERSIPSLQGEGSVPNEAVATTPDVDTAVPGITVDAGDGNGATVIGGQPGYVGAPESSVDVQVDVAETTDRPSGEPDDLPAPGGIDPTVGDSDPDSPEAGEVVQVNTADEGLGVTADSSGQVGDLASPVLCAAHSGDRGTE
jgi:hypothetical protein